MICLIADSHLDSLVGLRKALSQQNPRCRVITADAGRNAVELASQNPPDVVLADIRLSDMSGLKLLLKLKARHPGMITMMMSECGSLEARKMCLEAGVDFFFEKPVDMKRLSGMLEPSEPEVESVFRGTLDNLSVPDVLQLVSCRPSAMLMRIDSLRGNGSIEIEDGQVIHARANHLVGEKAFHRLVGWSEGHFEVVDVVCPEERTISISLPQLLMNAAQYLESPEAEQDERSELADGGYVPFFPPEDTAPDASHVWAPMAHYARPKLDSSGRRRVAADVPAPECPRLSAFRPSKQDSNEVRLRFKPRHPGPQRMPSRAPASIRSRRSSFAPAARRIAVACLIAMGTLLVGARYTGLISNEYGRDLAPIFDKLFGEFTPQAVDNQEGTQLITPSSAYQDLQQYAATDSPVDLVRTLRSSGTSLPALSVSVTQHEDLVGSANSVGVSDAVYQRMGLHSSPWVEVVGPAGKRIGALAVLVEDADAPVLLTQELADALSKPGAPLTHVRLRKVDWRRKTSQSALEFGQTRNLSGKYCEYWYSVGLSLEAMSEAGLMPGADAEIRGPAGSQAVRVQLYDRGDASEIWLSQPVRDAIGTSAEGAVSVKLYPKT